MFRQSVGIDPAEPRRGQDVSLIYQGILYQNGADNVWLHYGFDNWSKVSTIGMQRRTDGFHCQIKADGRNDMSFCFKDSADHWDNNNGMDWNISIK
ncbi:MAG: carbohydrate-binding protein [Bacillota bacterium]